MDPITTGLIVYIAVMVTLRSETDNRSDYLDDKEPGFFSRWIVPAIVGLAAALVSFLSS